MKNSICPNGIPEGFWDAERGQKFFQTMGWRERQMQDN